MAGAAQIFRIHRKSQYLRKGRVWKTNNDTFYFVTSLRPEEASPPRLLQETRKYWGIETKQRFRRDHTQREDHGLVREGHTARNLSLMRSAAIFL